MIDVINIVLVALPAIAVVGAFTLNRVQLAEVKIKDKYKQGRRVKV